ncbi:MAG: DNA repair protein RecN [Anaerolineae bacterium]|jgi:DNA repair protein RecN (Recombination protein N)|nr:DNA repair protein RecN [Anaerolineae bacterium]
MLKELRIKNFAIIDELTMNFTNELVILTGETGAGKSILLDAILTVMGAPGDMSFIRKGTDRAIVEAEFKLNPSIHQPLIDLLKAEDLLEDEEELTLSRELRSNGRAVARVNGIKVSVSLVRTLSEFLVDIHGQAEHLSLLNNKQHIILLDRYAKVEHALADYQKDYQALLALRVELDHLVTAQLDAERRMDLLTYQAEEIESAGIVVGEDEKLRKERDRLANAENLSKLANQSLFLLEEGDDQTPAIMDLIGEVSEAMTDLAKVDESQSDLAIQAEAVIEQLSEIESTLRDYLDTLEFNPARLDQVEERIDVLNQLKRKYGGSLPAVVEFGERCKTEIEQITGADERIAMLKQREQQQLAVLSDKAMGLSAARAMAAVAMSKGIEQELKDLSMDGAQFQVSFSHRPDEKGLQIASGDRVAFTELGIDTVEFLIAPNQGEGFKPLVKIASGGETARLMLALKNVLISADTIPTLIFDEIDQGIGGRIGFIVGEKLWRLARGHQVLCVTHLPQLAAFGDLHYHVEKASTTDDRTITKVRRIKGDQRRAELSAMLGGIGEANMEAAKELQKAAKDRQEQLTK